MEWALLVQLLLLGQLSYPYSVGVLEFPHDEGAHPADTVLSEWWYLNMALTDENSDSFGIMLTFFRKPAVARIFNLTDVSRDTFYSGVKILGSLNADTGHTYITYRSLDGTAVDTFRWTYPVDGQAFSYIIGAHDLNTHVSCSLRVSAFEYPFAIDSTGIVILGDSGNISYYYAIPFMNVTGRLSINDTVHNVTGLAWIDRQWGPFVVTPQGGYEWFSVVASENNKWLGLQIWNLFDGDSVPDSPDYWHLNIFGHTPDTSFEIYTSQFSLERLGYFHDEVSGKYFSAGWRLIWQNDSNLIFLEMHPRVDDQITTFVTSRFYEGITWISKLTANFQNENYISQVSEGYGYAELVQKYDSLITPPSAPVFSGFRYDSTSSILTAIWHPAEAGSYPIAGYHVYLFDPQNPETIRKILTTSDTAVSFHISPDSSVGIYISSFDSASATNGSVLSGPYVFNPHSVAERPPSSAQLFMEIYQIHRSVQLHIRANGKWRLQIYSPSGRLIKEITGNGESVRTLSFPSGVYFAELSSKGKIRRGRFIVIK